VPGLREPAADPGSGDAVTAGPPLKPAAATRL
jgi:hypothetical protein